MALQWSWIPQPWLWCSNPPPILLFLLCLGGFSQKVLTQSDALLKKLGEAHILTCSVTGFNIHSYGMDWVRKKSGQRLEQIVYHHTSSSNFYSPTIQGRSTSSKDNSNLYLQMNNLKLEDTAIYCITVQGRHSERSPKRSHTKSLHCINNVTLKGSKDNH